MRRGGYLSLIFSRKRFTKASLKYRTNNLIFSIHLILGRRCAHFWFHTSHIDFKHDSKRFDIYFENNSNQLSVWI